MSKKDDEWLYQYPSVTVNRKVIPTGANVTPYIGDANKLLYQTKNAMTFNNLDRLQSTRFILGDTGVVAKIIAGSAFGQDFIEIHIPSVAMPAMPSCSIILYNVPTSIPPMYWYAPGTETFTKVDNVWVINKPNGALEVEGVDYIKTYYSYSVGDCPDCNPLTFTVAEGENAWILTGSSPNRPFWYAAETYKENGTTVNQLIYTYEGIMVPHYMGEDWATPPVLPNPLKHTIHSLWGGCQAEIIKFDGDSGGAYFLWKAYTEWSNVGPYAVDFSRTGLGYMLMQGFITNQGLTLCESDPTIIKVDCCLKPASGRLVSLWWESLTAFQAGGPTCGGQSFMFYGTMKICEVPSEVAGIYVLLCVPVTPKVFYAIPEIQGGCLPFEWTVSDGAFIITPSLPSGERASLEKVNCSDELTCDQGFEVTVTDRCGTTKTVAFISCCENIGENPSLFISYTSLQMTCSASQTLSVGGQGCSPYTWSKTGGGSFDTTTGDSVVYTAPATNVNCASNPTITLTDCCGNTATLKLAVNCYTASDVLCLSTYVVSNAACSEGTYCNADVYVQKRYWNCNGTLNSNVETSCYGWWCFCTHDECNPCTNAKITAAIQYSISICGIQSCNYTACPRWNGCVNDYRTDEQKAAGCCPLNPITGLPF